MIETSPYLVASKYIGTTEMRGRFNNSQVMAMLRLYNKWPQNDEVPWCSAFVAYPAFLLGYTLSKALNARSWLVIGEKLNSIDECVQDSDIVILKRGNGPQPGPDILDAPGHVGYFSSWEPGSDTFMMLGGNQSNSVSIQQYRVGDILGIRRLMPILK